MPFSCTPPSLSFSASFPQRLYESDKRKNSGELNPANFLDAAASLAGYIQTHTHSKLNSLEETERARAARIRPRGSTSARALYPTRAFIIIASTRGLKAAPRHSRSLSGSFCPSAASTFTELVGAHIYVHVCIYAVEEMEYVRGQKTRRICIGIYICESQPRANL